ncbi:MAG: hypothetical protein ACRDUA_24905, partial [Micromonosporaceae bacterium]
MAVSLKISMLAAVSGAALVAFATPAVAAGEQFQERGRVVGVVDGDTVKVDLWGDGTSTPRLVRFTGIDTPEKSRCHGPAAHKRAKELALGRIVHLHSIDKNNMSGVRLRRTVLVAQGGG